MKHPTHLEPSEDHEDLEGLEETTDQDISSPAPARTFEGTPDQNAALDAILDWATDTGSTLPQLTRLLGLAGTGKTTVATELISRVRSYGVSTMVCAPTGKAASVLRRKGCTDATTLHRAIYKLEDDTGPELVWSRRNDARRAGLVVVDEASMVTTEMIADLRAIYKRILLVGDPGQLPPVSGDPALALPMPSHTLTQIHRQAEESGIIRFAHAVRAGENPSAALKKVGGKDVIKGLAPESVEVGISICAKNQTRTGANAMARLMRGFSGKVPQVGEKLMCLRNRRDDGWCNGMVCVVKESSFLKGREYARIIAECDDGEERESNVWLEGLDMTGMPRRDEVPPGCEPFAWGYSVTAHKSQGSEWQVVEVMESWPAWGKTPEEKANAIDTARRWAYTAATRAKTTLYWGA